jgi:hypothetical protein
METASFFTHLCYATALLAAAFIGAMAGGVASDVDDPAGESALARFEAISSPDR